MHANTLKLLMKVSIFHKISSHLEIAQLTKLSQRELLAYQYE
ncbi:MAG: hypothetical protein JWP81_1924 [Ferruginibacter sp.]|nr:hypothetical protein [Ferruginibacter sp.]